MTDRILTVSEVIEELRQYPGNMEVRKYCYQGECSDPNKPVVSIECENTDWRGNECYEFVLI